MHSVYIAYDYEGKKCKSSINIKPAEEMMNKMTMKRLFLYEFVKLDKVTKVLPAPNMAHRAPYLRVIIPRHAIGPMPHVC